MIDDRYSYLEMKETGLPWLPKIPAHWEVRRNGRLFGIRKETGYPELPVLEVSLRTGVRVRTFENGTRKQQMTDRSKYQRAIQGDIAYNMMRMWQGAVGVVPTDGLVSPAYVVVRPYTETVARYYTYLFRTAAYMHEVNIYSRGIVPDRNRLYWESFKQMPSAFPPAEEQRLIARFLDWHGVFTAKAIRAKQHRNQLLEEQRRVVVHDAVTCGLDTSTRRKPPGVPWLSEVPEHWNIMPLKRLAWFRSGAGFPVSEQGHQDLEIPFLKVSDMTRVGNEIWIESWNNTISTETALGMHTFIFPRNTIIFPKVGGAMLTNKRRIIKFPSCIDNNVMGCVVENGNVNFIFLLLQEIDFGKLCKPGPVPAISEGEVREIRVAVPPQPEQERIVEWVAARTRDLDHAIAITNQEVSLLHELHARLISDVVSGKLDVRAVAASLPETAVKPEPWEEPEGIDEFADDLETSDLEEAAA